jgi:hypothetical protein
VATSNAEERRMQEELDAIRQENADMRETVRRVDESTELKKNKAKSAYVANTQEYMSQFRDQAR